MAEKVNSVDYQLQIARQYGAPLDKYSVFYSLSEANEYAANSPISYVGQILSVVDETAGTVDTYKIQADRTLEQIGAGSGGSGGSLDGNYLEIANMPTVSLPSLPGVVLGYATFQYGVDNDFLRDLRVWVEAGGAEAAMFYAIALQADSEGYPEIATTFRQMAKHSMKTGVDCAEAVGEICSENAIQNLQIRIEATAAACTELNVLAQTAKAGNYDELHDFLHEMARYYYKQCQAMRGLYAQYANMEFVE